MFTSLFPKPSNTAHCSAFLKLLPRALPFLPHPHLTTTPAQQTPQALWAALDGNDPSQPPNFNYLSVQGSTLSCLLHLCQCLLSCSLDLECCGQSAMQIQPSPAGPVHPFYCWRHGQHLPKAATSLHSPSPLGSEMKFSLCLYRSHSQPLTSSYTKTNT